MKIRMQKIIARFRTTSEAAIERLQSDDSSFFAYAIHFFFIVQLRALFEDFSGKTGTSLELHLHFTLYYLCIAAAIILCLKLFTGETFTNLGKISTLAFSLILVGPLIDVISRGAGNTPLSYVKDESGMQLLSRFLTFFGAYEKVGASPGVKFHLGLILFCIFVYTWCKCDGNRFKASVCTFFCYCLIFASSVFPIFPEKLFSVPYSDLMLTRLYFLIFSAISAALFYLSNKHLFKLVFFDLRFLRTAYYLILIFLGCAIGYEKFSFVPPLLPLNLAILSLCCMFAILFSIVCNNLADIDIDRISNRERPSLLPDLPRNDYRLFAGICLLFSLTGACLVSYQAFLLIFLFIGCYYTYSMPPCRWKRITFFSKLAISFNSLFMTMLGYSLFLPVNQAGTIFLSAFPPKFLIFFLLLTFPANFIDIKDYAGDKAAGIRTLPVILGEKKAARLIGIFFLFPFIYIAWIMPETAPVSLLGGLIGYRFIDNRNYDERKIFILILINLFLLAIKLLLNLNLF